MSDRYQRNLRAAGLLAAALVTAAASPQPAARIVAVTVYPDRAEIVLQAEVEVPAGRSTLDFNELPWSLDPDSLRVRATGVEATLGGVDLVRQAADPGESPDLATARQVVSSLQRDMGELEAQESVAKELREFLRSVRATAAAKESERLGEGRADPAALAATYDLLETRFLALGQAALQRSSRREELQRDLQIAAARVTAAGPAGTIQTWSARLDLEARSAGKLEVQLLYVVPGASWRPVYRAHLDADTGRISLASEAVVSQTTGEDWSEVQMRLSTASPARGVQPPDPPVMVLRPLSKIADLKDIADRTEFDAEFLEGLPLLGRNYQGNLTLSSGVIDGVSHQAPVGGFQNVAVRARQAGIVRSAYNVSFDIGRRVTVAADGREQRVGIRQEILESTVGYRTVPGADPAAYLVATSLAPADYPLLAGVGRAFVAGAYVGSFPLPETGAGAELELPFGVDSRIAVERIPLPEARARGGVFGKEQVIVQAQRTTVTNRTEREVRITLIEVLPVAEDERFKVEVSKATTPGFSRDADRPGRLIWTLDLAPHEKRQIDMEYTLRHPRDDPPAVVPLPRR